MTRWSLTTHQLELPLAITVPGYQGSFAVDSKGNVYGIREHPNWPKRKQRLLRPYFSKSRNGNGRKASNYLAVHQSMARGLYQRHVLVHTLVARAFLGEPPTPEHQVDHLNGSRQDNRPENLEYVTPSENQLRKRQRGSK